MRNESEAFRHQTYGFRLADKDFPLSPQLYSIGWEVRNAPSYDFDNRQRPGEMILFQYTLRGEGALEINGETWRLQRGDGFLVEIPGEHRYYFPENNDEWEFIYVLIGGKNLWENRHFMRSKLGPVLKLDEESAPVRQLLSIYQQAAAKQIGDQYQASALAHRFLMELYRCAQGSTSGAAARHSAVEEAMAYVQAHYAKPIGLAELAGAAQLSRYHFSRLFLQNTGVTPAHYVTKIRLERAAVMLRQSNETVEHIATHVGFSNGNYFCKVFRKWVGTSPERFRQGMDGVPVDDLTLY